MSLVKRPARNHPQQVGTRGADPDVDDRATAPAVFGPINERFGFTVDVAASARNTKCARFFDEATDGLKQSWSGETVWCNPPYSEITPWIRKAWAEHAVATAIVMLLPANRTEQAWWQAMVEPFRDRPGSPLTVEFIAGRLRFTKPGQSLLELDNRPPFGCCLLIWRNVVYRPDAISGGLFTGDPA